MPFPQYPDLEEPLLCFIYHRGGLNHEVRARDTYSPLADLFQLSEQERKQSLEERNEPLWNNMV
jgi:hypothetical protein